MLHDVLCLSNVYGSLDMLWFRQFTMSEKWGYNHGDVFRNNLDYPCIYGSGARYQMSASMSLAQCRLVHLALGRFNHFKIEDVAVWDTIQWFVPAAYLRQAVDDYLTTRFYFSSRGYRVAVHRRAMKEGGHDTHTGSPYVCQYYDKSASKSGRYAYLRSLVERSIKRHWGKMVKVASTKQQGRTATADKLIEAGSPEEMAMAFLDMYDRTCAMSIGDIGEFLRVHRREVLVSPEEDSGRSGTKGEQFYLATDGQEPDVLQSWMDKHGAITANDDIKAHRWQRSRPRWSDAARLAKVYNEYGRICNEFKYYIFIYFVFCGF